MKSQMLMMSAGLLLIATILHDERPIKLMVARRFLGLENARNIFSTKKGIRELVLFVIQDDTHSL